MNTSISASTRPPHGLWGSMNAGAAGDPFGPHVFGRRAFAEIYVTSTAVLVVGEAGPKTKEIGVNGEGVPPSYGETWKSELDKTRRRSLVAIKDPSRKDRTSTPAVWAGGPRPARFRADSWLGVAR